MFRLGRPDPTPLRTLKDKSAEDVCIENIESFAEKANHNKHESHICFSLTIGCTLLTPVFLLVSDAFFFGKIVPALLSVVATASTAWLQLRKPQHLWGIYRSAQRRLENELLRFERKLDEYKVEDREDVFIRKQIALFEEVHERWASIIPNIDDLKKLMSNKP